MSKILVTDLPAHQRQAVLKGGEGALYEGRVLTRDDVETGEERTERLASEKAIAQEAAKVVEGGLADAIATGDFVPRSEMDELKAELAEMRRLFAESVKGLKSEGDAPETAQELAKLPKDTLVALAQAEGVTHETDANKLAIAEAIVKARAEKTAQGS